MKAKKIVPRIIATSQEQVDADVQRIRAAGDAMLEAAEAGDMEAEQTLRDLTADIQKALATVKAQTRELNCSNRAAIAEALNSLRRLEQVSDTKTALQEATSGLFRIIEEAQNRILKLTGAPGIISQAEIAAARAMANEWMNRSFAERMSVYCAPNYFAILKLQERFDAGWLVEPGTAEVKYDRTGVFCVGDRSVKSPRARRSETSQATGSRAARQADPETPSAETLQSWFDLPSDRPPDLPGPDAKLKGE